MELGEYVYRDLEKNTYLLKLYTNLLKKYATKQLNINVKDDNSIELNVNDLLRFADLLSKSTNDNKRQIHNNIAQNIVILLKKLYNENDNITATFISVLNNINNYRGIKEENYYNSDIKEFIYQYIEKEEFRVGLNNKEEYFVRDQKEIFNKFDSENYFSYSGPTSMGKTYVIKTFIQKKIEECNKKNFVIIVPTKALISEITSELIAELRENLNILKYKVINSYKEIVNRDYNYIMIYTQERFLSHLLNIDIIIDYVFIDEAHKIFCQDTRSIYFYKIIDILNDFANIPKIFFSAPLISNPDEFLKLLPQSLTKTYKVFDFSPVNQQKYIMDYEMETIRVYNDLSNSFIEIKNKESSNYDLISILKDLGENQKNLVFCESTKEAIELSKKFYDNTEIKEKNDKIEKLKTYIKNEIHKDYYLINLLDKGIAYHIGNVPNSIRKKIERLYKEKEIDTIFCTSTLLEGINLPADNLFIPITKRSKILKNDIDFKNLIGRVGRIRYNLSGNVFIIPKDGIQTVAKCTNMINKKIENKELSIKNMLTEKRKKDIVEKLKVGITELDKKSNNIEYEFSRYAMNSLIYDLINIKEGNVTKEFKKYLNDSNIKNIIDNFKDMYISQDMPITLDQIYLVNNSIKENLKYPDEANYNSILSFLEIMHCCFKWGKYERANELGSKKVLKYYATILNQWINGAFINQIIRESIKFSEKTGKVFNEFKTQDYTGSIEHINSIINNTLDTIERIILFKLESYFLKFSELYKIYSNTEKIDNDWYEFLSYGTNKVEVIELQKLGFSREIAIKIYKKGKYIFYENESFFISADIFQEDNEDIIGEAKEVLLNNAQHFKNIEC
jgi:replicative superfamily II helicase